MLCGKVLERALTGQLLGFLQGTCPCPDVETAGLPDTRDGCLRRLRGSMASHGAAGTALCSEHRTTQALNRAAAGRVVRTKPCLLF